MWILTSRNMFLPFFITVYYLSYLVLGNVISSERRYVEAKLGEPVTLSCNYSTSSSTPYLHWYRQYPQQIQYILTKGGKTYSSIKLYNPDLEPEKFKSDTSNTTTSLTIASLEMSDSALYLCAMSEGAQGNYKLIFGAGTRLTVHPRTSRTIPSVYRLEADKPKEDLPNTVCLVTDFPKPDTTLTVDEKEITLKETSALDKSTSDVWRYSAVIWDNDNPSKDLSCKVTYDGKDVPQEKNIRDETATTCSSLTVNERFSTNPSMNTLSLSVLGLRMLTAKAVIFNLIITLRLWSS